MAVETFEVYFAEPVLDFPTSGAPIPRWPWTDSSDGYFTSPGHYFVDGSAEEYDYSAIVDDVSSGAPGVSPTSGAFASIDNEAFRQAMTGVTLDAPSVRVRAKQSNTVALPAWDQVASVTVLARVVSRDSVPDIENVEYTSAYGSPDTMGALVTIPSPTTVFTDRTEPLNLSLTFQDVYERFANHLAREGVGELQVFRSGEYPWGVHDIAYMSLVITVETVEAPTPYRRTSHRHDSLAGGPGRNYPPSRALQTSNRIGGGYL